MNIDKDTVLGEIVKHKGAEEVLTKNGVPCVTCPMAKMEMDILKIGDVCQKYGLDLDKIVKELKEID